MDPKSLAREPKISTPAAASFGGLQTTHQNAGTKFGRVMECIVNCDLIYAGRVGTLQSSICHIGSVKTGCWIGHGAKLPTEKNLARGTWTVFGIATKNSMPLRRFGVSPLGRLLGFLTRRYDSVCPATKSVHGLVLPVVSVFVHPCCASEEHIILSSGQPIQLLPFHWRSNMRSSEDLP